ncbi:MAG: hypothetical protein IIZ80_05625 [Erysipelotrichaceae bacterium]|nr:hypothetical protein [Erysipelotrichaceae bacterium]
MKKLNTFKSFDLQEFLKGKKLILKSIRTVDSDTFKGARAEVVIVEDNTNYGKDNEGHEIIGVNVWNSFTVRMAGYNEDKIRQFKLNKPVRISEYTKATAWKPEGAFEEALTVDGVLVPVNENQH